MKRGTIIEAFKLINGIKMNVVSDKDTRSAITLNYLSMYKVAQENDEEAKRVYEKLFEGKEEDLRAVAELRQKFMSATKNEEKNAIIKELGDNYKHIFELEAEFNKIFADRSNEEVDIKVAKLDREAFVNACADSGVEFTMVDIIRLEDFFKVEEDKDTNE